MLRALCIVLCVNGSIAAAESILARETLRARSVVEAHMVEPRAGTKPGIASSLDQVVGKEILRTVYAGRPIRLDNLRAPAIVERNQVVSAQFSLNGLTIATEARALERGSAGDVIEAMNLTSRSKIRARVLANGHLSVLP